jgi:geranylgeranyl diphosphate synthase type I
LAQLVERAGGREDVEREAERQLAQAEARLAGLDIAPDVEAQILAIARFVTARDR